MSARSDLGGSSARVAASSGFDDAPVALLVSAVDGTVAAANRAWCELTGLAAEASTGDGWRTVFDDGTAARLVATIRDATAGGVVVTAELELVTSAGRRWTSWRVSPRHDGSGLVMAVTDLTADRARRDELEQRATQDPLTGMVNRAEFIAFVDHALRRLERHPGRVAVLFVDLDGFKTVNDRSGHLFGDEALAAAADRLSDAVRPTDVVARVGGDEFAVLCEDVTDGASAIVARRIEAAFCVPLEIAGAAWTIGASVGAATTDQPDTQPEALIGAADRAMYDVKTHKRAATVGAAAVDGGDERSADRVLVPERSTEPRLSVDLADHLIQELFAVGLSLTSCASIVDEPARSRLTTAIDGVDRIIHDVRVAVFDQHRGRPVPSSVAGTVRSGDIDRTVDLVCRTAGHLDQLTTTATNGPHTFDLLEAVFRCHSAAHVIEQVRPAVESALHQQPADDDRRPPR